MIVVIIIIAVDVVRIQCKLHLYLQSRFTASVIGNEIQIKTVQMQGNL